MKRSVHCQMNIGKFTSGLAGAGVYDALVDLDIPRQRKPGGWWFIPRLRLDDALVELELRKFPIVLTDTMDSLW